MALNSATQVCYPVSNQGYTPNFTFTQVPGTSRTPAPSTVSASSLGALTPAQSTPYATNLTASQGTAARAALGEGESSNPGGPSALDYTSDGIATLDHTARTLDHARRAGTLIRNSGRAVRAGIAGVSALEANQGLTRGLRVADGVLGPLGVASGAYGVYNGVNQIADGKVLEGTLDTVGGAAGVVSGGAATAGAVLGASAPVVLGALASGASGVAAAADGVKDIYQGVRDGNTEQAVNGGVKTVAGGLLIGGAATATPIAIGAGAVLYGGALIYENREAIGNAVSSAASAVGGVVSSGVEAVGGAISGAWNWAFG